MSNFSVTELEIIGFNGTPRVECGSSLPIARRKTDGAYTVLDFRRDQTNLNWYAEAEAENFFLAGRWTKFESPIFLPPSCRDSSRQPMVVYANETLLDTADRVPRPPMVQGEYIIWKRLQNHPEQIHAACASDEAVVELLDLWGESLLKRFDAMSRIGQDQTYLKRIADFALCASRSKDLRWRAYCYYATVQEPERVRSMFDTFVQREFPEVCWQDFLAELSNLRDYWQHAPAIQTPPGPPSSTPSTARHKLQGIVGEKRIPEYELVAS